MPGTSGRFEFDQTAVPGTSGMEGYMTGMELALAEARKALDEGEIAVGAVLMRACGTGRRSLETGACRAARCM